MKRLSKKHNKNCYAHQPQPTPLPPSKPKVFGTVPSESTCAQGRGGTRTPARWAQPTKAARELRPGRTAGVELDDCTEMFNPEEDIEEEG
ncbi:hypothetical protein EYF80_058703 [Liparis tanakae]|uniref:Uncharacterized protein n=1 Tax=Liparis tanakae TaxID=230148 RepID=A0A4Z2EQP7_9TELE|nr:hypothetical protein EYF80_058703 [Liparis tanakae]